MYKIREHKRGWLQVVFRWVRPDGTRRIKKEKSPFTRRGLTEEWAREREAELFRNDIKRKDIPKFSDFARDYLKLCEATQTLKPATMVAIARDVRRCFDPVIGSMRLDEIGKPEIQEIQASLITLSPPSVSTCMAHLAMIFNHAVDSDLLLKRPHIAIKAHRPQCPAFFTFDDYERLVSAATRLSIRTRVIILLGGEAGLRPGEILALDWPDLFFQEEFIVVRHTLYQGKLQSTKSGEPRFVPMSLRLRDSLRELQVASVVEPPRAIYGSRRGDNRKRNLRAKQGALPFEVPPSPPPLPHPRIDGPVIFTSDGRRPTIQTLHVWVFDAKCAAGLPDIGGVKILRHTFGRRLRKKKVSTQDIQELLGHADISTTLLYTEEVPETLREFVRRLDPLPKDVPPGASTDKPQPEPS